MPTSTAKLVLNPSSRVAAPPPTPPSVPTGPPWRRMSRQDSVSGRNPPAPPPPPPPPPMAGPPPPPPPAPENKLKPVAAQKLENLRKLPRKRPDWNCLMKEIEKGLKLKKVQTNDRSRPVLPQNKAKGKFVYDSEKANLHNQLLQQIQKGVRLKKSVCNDRSRPNIRGIAGFRRQVSVVEEPAAAVVVAEPAAAILEPEDDLDDIDRLRDDLQSTKQLLEIELKTKAKLESENFNLQNELRKLKEELAKKAAAAPPPPAAPQPAPIVHPAPVLSNHVDLKKSASRLFGQQRKRDKTGDSDEDDEDEIDFGELEVIEEEMNTLRGQAELARSSAEQWERSYKEASQKLVLAQANMEDLEHKVTVLQKKLKKAQGGSGGTVVDTLDAAVQTEPELWSPTPPPTQQDFTSATRRSASKRDLRKQMSRQDSRGSNLSSASLGGGDDMDGDSDEDEDEIEDVSKSQKRELSLLKSRVRSTKEKERNVRNERIALEQQQRKIRVEIRDEKKKLARLQKEVDRMAALLNEVEEESGKGEKVEIIVEEVEVTDDEEEVDEEADSGKEDDEESSEDSGEEDVEDVPEVDSVEDTESDEVETRITKLGERVHNHDNVLSTLKKGNYLLKTRVEKLQDELRTVRDRYVELEQELNTCLAELG